MPTQVAESAESGSCQGTLDERGTNDDDNSIATIIFIFIEEIFVTIISF